MLYSASVRSWSLDQPLECFLLVQAASVEAKLTIVLFQVASVESKLAIVFTAFFLFGSGVYKLTIVIIDFWTSLSLLLLLLTHFRETPKAELLFPPYFGIIRSK